MKTSVKVVIPFYKETLNQWESKALANNMQVLSAHPTVFLKPDGLSVASLTAKYPQAEVLNVSENWLGTKRGIAGYNEMMMSQAFYDLFGDTEYILICHTDAWVFRDELSIWCGAGYDLVAAPWPLRPRYRYFPFKQFLTLKKRFSRSSHGFSRWDLLEKIGNGGLCLRRVSAFSAACMRYAEDIKRLSNQPGGVYEDAFWALIPQELRYPSVDTALRFAFDVKPEVCYDLNNRQLPMGCHGFMHRSRAKFWQRFIPELRTDTE